MKTEYMTRSVTIKPESITRLAARAAADQAAKAQDGAEFMAAIAGGAIAVADLIKRLSAAQEEGHATTLRFTGAEFAACAMAVALEMASDCQKAGGQDGQTSAATSRAAAGTVALTALELCAALADELFSKDFNEEENPDAATDTDGSAAGV